MNTIPTRRTSLLTIPRGLTVLGLVALLMSPLTSVSALTQTAVVKETNLVRSSANVRRLLRSTTLDRAATKKAENMLQQQYFGHTSPNGVQFWSWLGAGRAKFSRVAENIARGYKREDALIRAWMTSAGHRENMLSPLYTHVGVGIRSGTLKGKSTVVVVEIFGKKRSHTPLTTTSVAR